MKIGQASGIPLTLAAVLISASLLSAQVEPMGNMAPSARPSHCTTSVSVVV